LSANAFLFATEDTEASAYGRTLEQLLLDGIRDIVDAPALEASSIGHLHGSHCFCTFDFEDLFSQNRVSWAKNKSTLVIG